MATLFLSERFTSVCAYMGMTELTRFNGVISFLWCFLSLVTTLNHQIKLKILNRSLPGSKTTLKRHLERIKKESHITSRSAQPSLVELSSCSYSMSPPSPLCFEKSRPNISFMLINHSPSSSSSLRTCQQKRN